MGQIELAKRYPSPGLNSWPLSSYLLWLQLHVQLADWSHLHRPVDFQDWAAF